jgi:hypothetical protein
MAGREHPIILRDWQVRAVLDGRMTTVRTPIKPQPPAGLEVLRKLEHARTGDHGILFTDRNGELSGCKAWSYYFPSRVGDRLWVRECWQSAAAMNICNRADDYIVYRATDPDWSTYDGWRWRSSATMPRKFSRIDLEVTAVRVERLQEISETDAASEGFRRPGKDGARITWYGIDKFDPDICSSKILTSYKRMWDRMNARRGFGWSTNPWVLVREFRRVTG